MVMKVFLELYEKLYQRRLLVRLIGVRFSHLVNGNYQINLFEDSENTIALYNAIDRNESITENLYMLHSSIYHKIKAKLLPYVRPF